MQSVLQVLKVNDPKVGTSRKTGQPYDMQDAECMLLDDQGNVAQVGVLQVPKSMRETIRVGTFLASFALQANFASRRIEAIVTALQPVKRTPSGFLPDVPATAGAK